MDPKNRVLTLWTSQTKPVLDALERDGVCYNKECYIRRKYGEVADVFLTAYRAYYRNASELLPPPPEAESAYWAFADPRDMFLGDDQTALKLEVPADQVILFDVFDWNRILQFRYLGETEEENRAFERELERRGITGYDVLHSNFYPDLRARILGSWKRLLRHHEALLSGDRTGVRAVQAGLWQLRREWICPPEGEKTGAAGPV